MKHIAIVIVLAELALAQDPHYPCQSVDPANCQRPQATETIHPIAQGSFTASVTFDSGPVHVD